MNILFFGSAQFSVPFLATLCNEPNVDVIGVVTQPDKPVGRGGKMMPSVVKQYAQRRNIPTHESLKHLPSADVYVVVAYGKILKKAVLDSPTFGCINVHPSLLPKYRGPSPLQGAILGGDSETGVTIMLMDEKMDTGPILAFERCGIDSNETSISLAQKMLSFAPLLLVTTLFRFVSGEIQPIQQQHSNASITRLLTKEHGRIDWRESADTIERCIRAYDPWPGAWTEFSIKNTTVAVKILEARVVGGQQDGLVIACGVGSLLVERLQLPSKRPISGQDFLRGYPHAQVVQQI